MPEPRPDAKIATLPPGQSGFADPWCLVEAQSIVTPTPAPVEQGDPIPPAYDPHSGSFYLWPSGGVSARAGGVYTMPVSREPGGGLVVAFGAADRLNHPPRLESVASIQQGGFLACRVEGLAAALAPPTAKTAARPTTAATTT